MEEITLPKITEKIEDVNIGSFVVPVCLGLETEITLYAHDFNIWVQHGLLNNTIGNLLSFRAYQESNREDVDEILIIMRGRFSEVDMGTIKRAEKNTYKIKGSLSAYTYNLNDKPYVVIEPLTNTYIIAGINQFEKQNKALGQ